MAKIQGNTRIKNLEGFLRMNRQTLSMWAEKAKCSVEDLTVKVTIEPPFRPRTTGYKSQNHCFNGILQIICQETGQDFQTTKEYVKSRAVEMGYPMLTKRKVGAGGVTEEVVTDWYGNPRGISEADSSVSECAILIECAMMLASELGITVPME